MVATEIRNLAQRTAEAAKESAAIIGNATDRFNSSSQRIEQITAAMHEVTSSAAQVKLLIDEVDAGSRQQAQGAELISSAMARIQTVASANAASARQSAAIGEKLDEQVRRLTEVVSILEW